MRQDLDRLMAERNLDAAMVLGSTLESPTIYYLTGGVKLEGAVIILRPGQCGVLIHSPMERDGAALTGLECAPASRWDIVGIAKEKNGDMQAARAEQIRRMLADYGVHGRIGFYGHGEIGQAHALLQTLASIMPDAEIAVEFTDDLFTTARITKDAAEIALLADVAQRSDAVVAAVADMLSSQPVSGNHLTAPGGEPLTVGHVKAFIREACARQQLEQPGENIFALGADAAVPHNQGNPADVLTLGTPIIFDFFPRPVGGGYFHDMTRTWCLGYAPAAVETAYEQVMTIFDQVMASLQVGQLCASYQVMTCDYFAAQGHPTILTEPTTEVGYVHGLAHGLGLEIHEAPSFRAAAGNTAAIQPGMVFTVEPGLYYTERGYGVRVEDTVYCDAGGAFHSLTPFSKKLVLPVRR
jgi:Xaa-Pro aminopeptidase